MIEVVDWKIYNREELNEMGKLGLLGDPSKIKR